MILDLGQAFDSGATGSVKVGQFIALHIQSVG